MVNIAVIAILYRSNSCLIDDSIRLPYPVVVGVRANTIVHGRIGVSTAAAVAFIALLLLCILVLVFVEDGGCF